jgi:hypothetical protein
MPGDRPCPWAGNGRRLESVGDSVNVYLVPVRPPGGSGKSEFALYCEPPLDASALDADGNTPGLFQRMARSFRQALADGEAERRRREAGQPESREGSWLGRLVKRKLADSVAEHRVLWALRRVSSATLFHSTDVDATRAVAIAAGECRRDRNKHAFWCVVDGLLFVASGLIAVIPGPNLIAYYLLFRCVSHYLSLVGAVHGARPGTWVPEASTALADVAAALALPIPARDERLKAASAALGLERLPAFVSRMSAGARRRP